MLSIKTYLAPSAVHGIGLFAAEDIPAFSMIWQFNKHIDKILSEHNFLRTCRGLNNHALKHFLNSTYRRGGRYFYLTDNARFINHSDDFSNIYFADDFTEIASRDIRAHEELLEDYRHSYDPEDFFFQELSNPDPGIYVLTMQVKGPCSVDCKNLS